MRKILIIANYKPGTGGISGQVEKLHQCLNQEGVENVIFSVKGSFLYRIVAFFRLFKVGRQYDVFHVHTCSNFGFISAVYGVIVGRCLGKRIVLTYHGGGAESFFKKRHRWVRRYLLKTDANIVLSGFLGRVFDAYQIPYVIIPNVIELDGEHFRERNPVQPRFISVRTLAPLYNIECILRAFTRVKAIVPNASLFVLGDGPSREALEEYVKKQGLQDVTFVGRVDNSMIYDYLDQADIMLSAPRIDNMPVSVLEAMNAGLLVISSRVGGVPYMIEEGVNGLLFESDNDEALAEKMLLALHQPEKTVEMCRNAKEALGQYAWDSVREPLLNLYKA